MNDLQEQVKVEQVPADKNEQGVEVSLNLKNGYIELEHHDLGERRNLPAPSLSVHQVHRHLPQVGAVLRPDCAPPKAHLHQARFGVHDLPYLRDEERLGAF